MRFLGILRASVLCLVTIGFHGQGVDCDGSLGRRLSGHEDVSTDTSVDSYVPLSGSWLKSYGLILFGVLLLSFFLIVISWTVLQDSNASIFITSACSGAVLFCILLTYFRAMPGDFSGEALLSRVLSFLKTFALPVLAVLVILYFCFLTGVFIYFRVEKCTKGCSKCSSSPQCSDCTNKFFGCCCCCCQGVKDKCEKCKSCSGGCKDCETCKSGRDTFIAFKTGNLGVLFGFYFGLYAFAFLVVCYLGFSGLKL